MPTLISRGTAAARAFGLTGSSSGQLYTQTFTSNGTFTPMAGVTNVVTLVGQGGSSSSDFQTALGDNVQFNSLEKALNITLSGPYSLPLDYITLAQPVIDIVNQCNAGGMQTFAYSPNDYWTTYYNDTYDTNAGPQPATFSAYTIAGTWSVTASGLPFPATGSVTSWASAPTGYYKPSGQYIAAGSAGGNSSALGYTFPGAAQAGTYPNATGQSATPVTYSSIPVTPGTNYPIVVSSGGYVSISFIIP